MKALVNLTPNTAVFNYDNTKFFIPEEVERISRIITVASILFIVCAILLVTFVLMFVFSRKAVKTKVIKKSKNIDFLNFKNGGDK